MLLGLFGVFIAQQEKLDSRSHFHQTRSRLFYPPRPLSNNRNFPFVIPFIHQNQRGEGKRRGNTRKNIAAKISKGNNTRRPPTPIFHRLTPRLNAHLLVFCLRNAFLLIRVADAFFFSKVKFPKCNFLYVYSKIQFSIRSRFKE